MSIKKELENLRVRNADLQEKLIPDVQEKLKNEKKKREVLRERKKIFSSKNSQLAKSLLAECEEELSGQEKNVRNRESELAALEAECTENGVKITQYTTDVSFYIVEQVKKMVSEFNDFVKKNEKKLGMAVSTTFYLSEVFQQHHCRWEILSIPNGHFILNNNLDPRICTDDYYFDERIAKVESCYETRSNHYQLTPWYMHYKEAFFATFISGLQKGFQSENFRLENMVSRKDNEYSFTITLI